MATLAVLLRDPGDRPSAARTLPARRPPSWSHRPQRFLVVLGAAGLGLVAVAATLLIGGRGDGALEAGHPAPTSSSTPASTEVSAAPDVRGPVVRVGSRHWRVARAADVVAVGDWDCDEVATPAVLRPATGEVWAFDTWAGPGEAVTARAVGRVEGAMAIAAVPPAAAGACATLELRLASGAREVLRP